jgi:DNA-binding SARP family transcriptional activator
VADATMTPPSGSRPSEAPDLDIEIRILGAISVRLDGRRVDIGEAKHRLILAMLVAAEGRTVPVSLLIDQIWGANPPQTALELIYSYVSDLRRCFKDGQAGADRLLPRLRDGGYRLLARAQGVDLYRFRELGSKGRSLARSDDAQARTLLRQALSQWETGSRGNPGEGPLSDLTSAAVADCQWLEGYRRTLREEYRALYVACIEAELRLGEHDQITAELAELCAADPLDEQIVGLLMLAYHRSGRQAEATRVYRRTRERLRDQLGADPGKRLRDLHQAILAHDSRLDLPSAEGLDSGPISGGPRAACDPAAKSADARPSAPVQVRPKPGPNPNRRRIDSSYTAEKYLVGRDEEVAKFDRMLADDQERPLLNIYGPSGIGKSIVCWKLAEHARNLGLLVGAADVSASGSTPVALLRELASCLLTPGAASPSETARAFAGQLEEYDTVSEIVQRSGGLAEMFDSVGAPKNPARLGADLDLIGAALPATFRATMHNRFALDRYLRTAPQRLGAGFSEVLAAAHDEGRRAVLLMDTYEEAHTLDGWVRRTLLPDLPANTRLVILGRNQLSQQNFDWADYGDVIQGRPLPELAEREAKSYLSHYGLRDLAALDQIYRFTGGYPLLLVLVRQLAQGVGGWAAVGHLDHTGDRDLITSQLLTQILREERVHEVRDVLEKCAIAAWINPEIIKALLDVTASEAREIFEKVRKHSFMERHPEGVRLHEKIRALLIERIRFTSQEEFDRLEGKLLAYHSSKVGS